MKSAHGESQVKNAQFTTDKCQQQREYPKAVWGSRAEDKPRDDHADDHRWIDESGVGLQQAVSHFNF